MATPVAHTPCERDIQKLRHKLIHMSIKVRAIVSASVQALVERDSSLARVLIAADRDVDRLEIALDHMCLRILAARQPVAKEARMVALCVKMVTDLERVADLGTHICEEALLLNVEPAQDIDPELPLLGHWVEAMVHDAMTAFDDRDSQAARRVIDDGPRMHAGFAALFARLLSIMMKDYPAMPRVRRLYAIATHLERIGDHATNLAEMVVFMVEGQDVRQAIR